MEFGILTTEKPNSREFEIFTLKVAEVIQEYLTVAFLYVLSSYSLRK